MCWLEGCTTKEPHGHWVVDRGCPECLAYALTSPELVGQATPPRPYHHTICGKHGSGESELCLACDEKLRAVIEGHDKDPETFAMPPVKEVPVIGRIIPEPKKPRRVVKKPQPSMSRRKRAK